MRIFFFTPVPNICNESIVDERRNETFGQSEGKTRKRRLFTEKDVRRPVHTSTEIRVFIIHMCHLNILRKKKTIYRFVAHTKHQHGIEMMKNFLTKTIGMQTCGIVTDINLVTKPPKNTIKESIFVRNPISLRYTINTVAHTKWWTGNSNVSLAQLYNFKWLQFSLIKSIE